MSVDRQALPHRIRDLVVEAAHAGSGGRPTRFQLALTPAWLVFMITATSVAKGEFELPGPRLWAAILLSWAPLLARTYRPGPMLAATVLAEATHLALLTVVDQRALDFEPMGAYQPVPLATMLAAYTLATRIPYPGRWIGGGGGAITLVAVAAATTGGQRTATNLTVFNLVILATGLGAVVANRRLQAEQRERERIQSLREAVLDERLRIARELHDVLAHNLTLVNAQATVAEYLMRHDPPAASAALRDIASHTGRAIDELRATVGLLRYDDTTTGDELVPPAGLARLDDLVATIRSSGAPVTVEVTGSPVDLADNVDLAAYRIVQEALTNTVKHAPGAAVTVALVWAPERLSILVANGPAADRMAPRAPGTGSGLIGMRERAQVAGGTVTTADRPDGGFEVRAALPTREPGERERP